MCTFGVLGLSCEAPAVEGWLGQKTKTPIWAKVGLAKIGHPNFGQSRSIKVGQSRSNFFCQSRFGQSQIAKVANVGLAKVGLAKVGISQNRMLDLKHTEK